jgi:hypothetical protein
MVVEEVEYDDNDFNWHSSEVVRESRLSAWVFSLMTVDVS